MRKTKILATLGPACNNVKTMKKMIEKGLDGARINCSHGTVESRLEIVNNLKAARAAAGKHVALLLDTKGPEIRTKTFANDVKSVRLEQGAEFILTTDDIEGDNTKVAVTHANLPKEIKVGHRVLIDDGLLEMKVTEIKGSNIKCILVNSGELGTRKGVNLPDSKINLPSLTDQDVEDIKFGINEGFDFVAASFVRTADDIINIRKVLDDNGGKNIHIIAKIESRDGVNNLDDILEVADGVMVARGDLGVEIPPEEVPKVQKSMIFDCNIKGKPVITATHMLESMVSNPRPTRAEANDVANAIYDGTDVIMLSGETANGKYPVEAISMMDRIARVSEEDVDYEKLTEKFKNFSKNVTLVMSQSGVATAREMGATCIVPITDSGFAARMVSRFRPQSTILAITSSETVCRQLCLSWGCVPLLAEKPFEGCCGIFDIAEDMALRSGFARPGEVIVALAGVPSDAGATNTMRVRTVGDVIATGTGNNSGTVQGVTRLFSKGENDGRRFFEQGDIIVCTQTDNSMLEYIRKAGGIVVGSWADVDTSHAETVAEALGLPLLRVNIRATEHVKEGTAVTIDSDKGLLFNGYK